MVDHQWRRFRLFVILIVMGLISTVAAAGRAAEAQLGLKSSAAAQRATITAQTVYFEPYDLLLQSGVPVVLEFRNDGRSHHDLVIDGINIIDGVVDMGSSSGGPKMSFKPGTVRLVAGKGQSVRVTFIPRVGRFDFYCSEAGHRGAGMRGTIVVR